MNELVSVYIPTHNRRKLLERAIQSVHQQTYVDIELIIVDDGSSDDTWDYLRNIANKQIRVFRHEEPLGACAARNLAIKHAKGKFITGLDDDDEFQLGRIKHLVENYDEKYSFTCTGFLWNYGKKSRAVDCTGKIITLDEQLNYNYATNQVLVEAERLREVGGFDESFVACQDYDIWTRLIKKYGSAKRIAGASYIIHRGDNIDRITEPTNWLKGHAQFIKKHGSTMTNKNKVNQSFKVIVAERRRLDIFMFLQQLKAGLAKQKVRYFLSSNFKFLNKIRRSILD